jgi:hypothetical protein
MKRFTQTTLGSLRIGDRFTFMRKKETVWQVTGKTGKYVTINQFNPDGRQVLQFDELKTGTTPVIFMRHTIPMPGEECYVQDLKEGDVFYTLDNVTTEFERCGNIAKLVVAVCEKYQTSFPFNTVVVFVKHGEEVNA